MPESLVSRDIYSVSRLVRETRAVLEGSFPLLWIEGEISNLAQPASGHLYFSLKDEAAQVRCAMFRGKRQHLRFQPGNGQQVLIRARVSLYETRGEFQLVAEHMEPAGEGALRLAFERLKAKLDSEGLFSAEHKHPLPPLPRQIGLITSPSGAAIRDLLSVLKRRFPAIPLVIYPVAVQGTEAPAQIVEALRTANHRAECDLLILSRGGGSLEDLQAFNEESVARAIHASEIPLITGIGHEIDFTIADFVADLRAPTPSAAAEHATPDQQDWRRRNLQLKAQLANALRRCLADARNHTHKLDTRLLRQHPSQQLQQHSQRLDDLSQRLHQAAGYRHTLLQSRLNFIESKLSGLTPSIRLERLGFILQQLQLRLLRSCQEPIAQKGSRLGLLAQQLHGLSPLAILDRGYAIVTRADDGSVLRSSTEIAKGERVNARLADGTLSCEVIDRTE
jgi:exodeoxyribonuclease VII large subunit